MKADAAAEAAALDCILDEVPALDGPWQCCIISTSLPPSPPPRTRSVTPAANSATSMSATIHGGAEAAAPITTTATAAPAVPSPAPLSCAPSSSFSSSSSPPSPAPRLLDAVAGTPSAAISAMHAKFQATKEEEHMVLQHTCTASLAPVQQQLSAAPAGWPHACTRMDKSLSCQLQPTRTPPPAAELLPQCFSAPCIPHHMDAQWKCYSSPLACSPHLHHALRS
uniref:Uncharacterized protein n=1 Tax=Dunaliella tertiolecta TaxID=3047 RepID=A0A7S3QP70_DUNTE